MIAELALALALHPQQPGGTFENAPVSVSVSFDTATSQSISPEEGLKFKWTGEQSAAPGAHPTGTPYFHGTNAPWEIDGVDIDAFSTNMNIIPSNSDGVIKRTLFEWGGIVFSVTELSGQFAGPDRGASLFEYMYYGSTVATPRNEVLTAIPSSKVRLTSGAGQNPTEITSLDVFPPSLYSVVSPVPDLRVDLHGVLFSTTNATAATLASHYSLSNVTGSTVLYCQYQAATSTWVDPVVYWQPDIGTKDLNALAWQFVPSRSFEFLLFSTNDLDVDALRILVRPMEGATTPSPIPPSTTLEPKDLMYDPAEPDGETGATQSGPGAPTGVTNVSSLIGRGLESRPRTADIDGLSAFDPVYDFSKHVGHMPPQASLGANATMFRRPDAAPGSLNNLHACMTPTMAPPGPTAFAGCWVRQPGQSPTLHSVVPIPPVGTSVGVVISGLPANSAGTKIETAWSLYTSTLTVYAYTGWVEIDL